ncbi:acyltransferase [Leptotrichia sp. HSP-334]|uniref:Acyltransferase n=1 Tax=Leptotrichia rugosa TaxID=3239302 RepID=A0AB39VH45_9FUSO
MAIDIIRILAFIFIVLLHTVNIQYGVNIWILLYGVISIGVNLFIMISGYLLLDKSEKMSVFFKKRIRGIFPLFIFFNIVYIFVNKVKIMPVLQGKEIVAPHFWYIYMILGLYFITPWLQKVLKFAKKETFIILVLWFLCSILNPHFIKFDLPRIPFSHFPITEFIGYYILGYYIKVDRNKIKKVPFSIIIIIYLIGFFISAISTKYVLLKTGNRISDFFDKNSLGTFFMTVSFFTFFIKLDFKNRNEAVKIVSNSTYFAFLVHLLVLKIVVKFSDEMIFKSFTTVIISILLGIIYEIFVRKFFLKIKL